MKLAHLADLHIGKRVNDFSMLEDQKYILEQILQIIKEENVEAVLIAGDVYDKSMPSAEAVALCDAFLTELSRLKLQTFMISGNHDCPERIAFGAKIMEQLNVHIAPVFDGSMQPYTMRGQEHLVQEELSGHHHHTDNNQSQQPIDIYMLPFIKPAMVRRFYPDTEIHTYTDAIRVILDHTELKKDRINVLLAHQFVTGAARCESEEVVVGGLDNVDYEVFDGFDYVALGHIHGPQRVGRDTIRYSGTPLKYSFSEVKHKKSVTIVTIGEESAPNNSKCNENKDVHTTEDNVDHNVTCGRSSAPVEISTIPLQPLRDLREIKGTYEEITLRDNYICTNTEDYMHITLTDEEDIPDAIGKLRAIYPNIMKLDYDNKRTRSNQQIELAKNIETQSPLELFMDFYQMQNNQEMSKEQQELVMDLIEKIWNK